MIFPILKRNGSSYKNSVVSFKSYFVNYHKDLRGAAIFECRGYGLHIDRQLNAAINLYLRMEGVPHGKEQWDANILPTLLVGGYALTGAERKGADELMRLLHDAVKPQIYVEYNRYADAYLPMPT